MQRARRWRIWWGAGLALALGAIAGKLLAPAAVATDLLILLLVLWLAASLLLALGWLWRRLTYRIGVRLFLSYLLIGVMPFALMLAVAVLGGYILIGQYCSARYADLMRDLRQELEESAEAAAAAAAEGGPEAAVAGLGALGTVAGVPLPRVEWLLAGPSGSWQSTGAAAVPIPGWAVEETVSGPFEVDGTLALAAVAGRGEWVAAVFVPLDLAAADAISQGRWYEVRFLGGDVESEGETFEIRFGEEGVTISSETPEQEGEPQAGAAKLERFDTAGTGEGPWRRRWIYFIRPGAELRRWQDGAVVPREVLVSLLLTSPAEAAADLFRSPYELGPGFFRAFVAVSLFFFVIYLGIVAFAGVQILSVARSTARLTRGTQRVEAGDLGHRIPVRRRDQLGDLTLSFNRMAEAVEEMLAEVGEKERLKRELELAREIQQSLLPDRELRCGPLAVHAFFRPAAEVGGDYFDLFPLAEGRLLVTVGDVAGHGLPTGLLMAGVKAAVATLVREGHRGPDLLVRLNHLMLDQPREHRLVTLAAAEIDAGRGRAELCNAGHPPPFVLAPGGEAREVLLPSLPAGTRWREPPPSRRLSLVPGSRLLFYSDGLIEAADAAGGAFGYERLRQALVRHAGLASSQLLAAILGELEAHTGGAPPADDLTLLAVDFEAPG